MKRRTRQKFENDAASVKSTTSMSSLSDAPDHAPDRPRSNQANSRDTATTQTLTCPTRQAIFRKNLLISAIFRNFIRHLNKKTCLKIDLYSIEKLAEKLKMRQNFRSKARSSRCFQTIMAKTLGRC